MATYVQPTSAASPVLGTKCFAYSTLNALAHSAVALPPIAAAAGATPQLQADNWISAQATFVSIGGGPGTVLKALNLVPKQIPVQYKDHMVNRAVYAAQHNLPTVLATTVGGSNHWIYLTGASAAGIVAEDQQNTARGALTFTKNANNAFTATAGGVTYTLNNISVFITAQAQKDTMDKL